MGEEQAESVHGDVDPEVGFDTDEVIKMLEEFRGQGIDFEDDDFEHLRDMPCEEAMEYLIFTLESAGLDAESSLLEHGILQSIEKSPDEVIKFQNRGLESYTTEQADELVQGHKPEED